MSFLVLTCFLTDATLPVSLSCVDVHRAHKFFKSSISDQSDLPDTVRIYSNRQLYSLPFQWKTFWHFLFESTKNQLFASRSGGKSQSKHVVVTTMGLHRNCVMRNYQWRSPRLCENTSHRNQKSTSVAHKVVVQLQRRSNLICHNVAADARRSRNYRIFLVTFCSCSITTYSLSLAFIDSSAAPLAVSSSSLQQVCSTLPSLARVY